VLKTVDTKNDRSRDTYVMRKSLKDSAKRFMTDILSCVQAIFLVSVNIYNIIWYITYVLVQYVLKLPVCFLLL